MQGMASKGLGACAILALLCMVYRNHKRAWPVLLWWAWEELQVALCSVAWMLGPWTVEPGQGICQARMGFDIGAAGLIAVAALAYTLSGFTGSNPKQERQK